jgi:hypothetical protein
MPVHPKLDPTKPVRPRLDPRPSPNLALDVFSGAHTDVPFLPAFS